MVDLNLSMRNCVDHEVEWALWHLATVPVDRKFTVYVPVDEGNWEVMVGDERVDLTFTEFRVLHILARRRGWVFTRHQIVDAIHGESYPVTDRAVDVHIVALRKKLGAAGDRVETVRGVGYRFKD